MKTLLLTVLMIAPAFADWTRVCFDGKGGGEDKPAPQPFRYFTQLPSLHDVSGDFCYLCTETQRRSAAKKEKVKADVRFLGRFSGRAVYDILYYFDNRQKPSWKSLIVQRDRGAYSEILQVHQISLEGISHSRLTMLGDEQLICARDNCDRSGCSGACFRIERTEVYRVDIPPSEK